MTNITYCGSIQNRYIIMPLRVTPTDKIVDYWNKVEAAGFLPIRLCALKKPTMADMYDLMAKFKDEMFFIMDVSNDTIVGEFLVSVVSGKMGTIHFSANPEVPFKRAIEIGAWCTDTVLNEWTVRDKPDEPYLTSLVGMTPAQNRRACLYVLKTGFKKIAEIPYGCSYNGEWDTALMTIKSIKGISIKSN